MHLIAYRVGVVSGCGDQKIQRLHTCVAGALDHHVVKLPVGLCVQFVKNNAVGVEAVLVGDVCGKHLIEAVGRFVDELLLRIEDLHSLRQRRAETHHIDCDVKDDLRLVAVRGTSVHLCALLPVAAGQKKRDRRCELGFSLFFRDLHIGGIELPVAVFFEHAEQIAYDLLLPVDQFKWFSGPCAFRMAQRLDEHHGVVGGFFIVMRGLQHERSRRVFLQLSHVSTSTSTAMI